MHIRYDFSDKTYQLIQPHLYHRGFIFVAPAPLVSVALDAFEVLAACGIIEHSRRSEYLLLILLGVGFGVREVAQEMRCDRGVGRELRVVHDFGRESCDLLVHPVSASVSSV